MTTPYVEPVIDRSAFNCPICGAFANFHWSDAFAHQPENRGLGGTSHKAAYCQHCKKWTLWVNSRTRSSTGLMADVWRLVYPQKLTSPRPSPDLPEDCTKDYQEARTVMPLSPRAAAALLRLCIQRLCKDLGGKGENLNDDIGLLVKNGLDGRIRKALDIVRVTGNNAVHPGQMSLDDNPEIADKLFSLVNLIVEEMITKPKELDSLYNTLPESAREGIEKRDKDT